jgi:hypothetical protein
MPKSVIDELAVRAPAPAEATAFDDLGSALVHAARGSDAEGVTLLRRVPACDGAAADTVGHAPGELAHVEFPRGHDDAVDGWSARAAAVSTVPALRSAAPTVRGSSLSDVGRYSAASAALQEAFDLAQDECRRAHVLSTIGRVHPGNTGVAVTALLGAAPARFPDGYPTDGDPVHRAGEPTAPAGRAASIRPRRPTRCRPARLRGRGGSG